MTPDEALDRLKDGNRRHLAGEYIPVKQTSAERRASLAQKQQPFCVLVGCSDSRVPPEVLFGCGLGEIFIVRNAGNSVDTAAMGSIEYGVAVLGAPLVVVLGHERCGAVQAAVDVVRKDATFPGSIGRMIEPIIPAVLRASREGAEGDLLDRSVRENVRGVVDRLRHAAPLLVGPQQDGTLRIVGARYDLDDGTVEFFE
ncbi:MAG: carbonic anhydrase [Gluconacetobacter diazotrophicus]|nr:carbonic anhydrase [Gluconacetobacter diazotrophicus]